MFYNLGHYIKNFSFNVKEGCTITRENPIHENKKIIDKVGELMCVNKRNRMLYSEKMSNVFQVLVLLDYVTLISPP